MILMTGGSSQNRIYIIGASGTGKTTLAQVLAQELDCPQFDSDDYYHYPTDPPYQKQRSPQERASLLANDLNQHSSWVLSGGAGVWKPRPIIEFTLVVFLHLPPLVRIERLRNRERELYGLRIQPGGDMESTHIEFMDWTQGYDAGTSDGTCTLPCHQKFLREVTCPVVRIEGPVTTQEQAALVIQALA